MYEIHIWVRKIFKHKSGNSILLGTGASPHVSGNSILDTKVYKVCSQKSRSRDMNFVQNCN